MPLIIPDFGPRKPEVSVVGRVAAALLARLEGEWDVVGDARLVVCMELARTALGALRLDVVSGSSLGLAAERVAPKGGIMLPGAGTVDLWNAMLDVLLEDGVRESL